LSQNKKIRNKLFSNNFNLTFQETNGPDEYSEEAAREKRREVLHTPLYEESELFSSYNQKTLTHIFPNSFATQS